jgi:hypothetical protein
MCARIGMVTGQGLAGNFKQRFPSWLLRVFVMALLAANTINIAAQEYDRRPMTKIRPEYDRRYRRT